jgi:GT2 family glycosyltransferase
MLVSVVIINYNTFKLTCDCIESIIRHTKSVAYEIVLVDNASTKDNPDEFLTRFPQIRLVKSAENGGFAKGNNLGIASAQGDVIVLFNSDAYLIEDTFGPAAKRLMKTPDCGALSVKLVYEDGSYQRNARRFRSIRNELLDCFRPLLYLIPYRQRAVMMLNQYFRGDFDTKCDWISGAFMMMRKVTVTALPGGKLDERYFMYGEDQLWGYQLKQIGLHCYFIHDITAVHIANASTSPEKLQKLFKLNLHRELDIMRARKGASAYYYVFKFIFVGREALRHWLKRTVRKVLDKEIR